MFWKYIEKINWGKVFHHFLGMKYKALDILLAYKGQNAFNIKGEYDRYRCHGGASFEIEVLGVEFSMELYDYRHWNYAENRFYYDEEPELSWIGYKGYTELDYWRDIEKTAQNHTLDEDYFCRCQAVFMEYKEDHTEEARKRNDEAYAEYERKVAARVQAMDWSLVKYARVPGKRKKRPVRQVKEKLIGIKEFRVERKLPADLVIALLDLYDKDDNLISRAGI